AGTSVAVTDKGIVFPGSTSPVPDTSGLNPVLDGAGVSMKYLRATSVGQAVVSAGLVVSVKQAGPTGDVVVTYTFGRATASASGSATQATGPGIGVGTGTATPGPGGLAAPSTGVLGPQNGSVGGPAAGPLTSS